MSASQIDAYRSGWRMPTAEEDARFVRGPNPIWQTWVSGDTHFTYTQGVSTTGTSAANFYGAGSGSSNPAVAWFPVIQGANPNSVSGVSLPASGTRAAGNGAVADWGVLGRYWSATAKSSTQAYHFYFNATSMYVGYAIAFGWGYAVRCVRTDDPLPPPAPYLVAGQDSLPFYHNASSAGGSQSILILTNEPDWSFSVDGADATDFTATRSGNTLTVYPKNNNTTALLRQAKITVTAGALTTVIPVSQRAIPNPGSNDILYFVGDVLHVGKHGVDITATNFKDIAYFNFGSVIGIGSNAGWSASSVRFNTTGAQDSPTDYTVYADIPKFNDNSTDWKGSIALTPLISDPRYHNGANVKSGKGDPCRLVGLSAHAIRGMSASQIDAYNSGWRMPSAEENVHFAQGPNPAWQTRISGDPNIIYTQSVNTGGITDANFYHKGSNNGSNPDAIWFPLIQGANPNSVSGVHLPATGFFISSGALLNVYNSFSYLSASARSLSSSNKMFLFDTTFYPAYSGSRTEAYAVRCVRDN